jgi:hypothetical protein
MITLHHYHNELSAIEKRIKLKFLEKLVLYLRSRRQQVKNFSIIYPVGTDLENQNCGTRKNVGVCLIRGGVELEKISGPSHGGGEGLKN